MEKEDLYKFILDNLKEGKTTREIVELLKDEKTSSGNPFTVKAINNIKIQLRKRKLLTVDGKVGDVPEVKIRNNDGCIFKTPSGKFAYRKMNQRKIVVFKQFDTKEEAEEFKKQFMESYNAQQPKKRGPGRPRKDETESKTKEPKLVKMSSKDITQESGFVVIIGKDSRMLSEILSKFEM